ncbi:hypothetical protein AcW1_007860 [Taiwanofungus camphoratus]|nr:hypothetical protein AcW2_007082 [Antrodia cinnamomea]KAI0926695.1 hypothetical protein AcV5_007417 [Antrodia cinnamomea]KAI0953709.1 hypothetical protein AcW1_007860 [Antrodia cinnamomea]
MKCPCGKFSHRNSAQVRAHAHKLHKGSPPTFANITGTSILEDLPASTPECILSPLASNSFISSNSPSDGTSPISDSSPSKMHAATSWIASVGKQRFITEASTATGSYQPIPRSSTTKRLVDISKRLSGVNLEIGQRERLSLSVELNKLSGITPSTGSSSARLTHAPRKDDKKLVLTEAAHTLRPSAIGEIQPRSNSVVSSASIQTHKHMDSLRFLHKFRDRPRTETKTDDVNITLTKLSANISKAAHSSFSECRSTEEQMLAPDEFTSSRQSSSRRVLTPVIATNTRPMTLIKNRVEHSETGYDSGTDRGSAAARPTLTKAKMVKVDEIESVLRPHPSLKAAPQLVHLAESSSLPYSTPEPDAAGVSTSTQVTASAESTTSSTTCRSCKASLPASSRRRAYKQCGFCREKNHASKKELQVRKMREGFMDFMVQFWKSYKAQTLGPFTLGKRKDIPPGSEDRTAKRARAWKGAVEYQSAEAFYEALQENLHSRKQDPEKMKLLEFNGGYSTITRPKLTAKERIATVVEKVEGMGLP